MDNYVLVIAEKPDAARKIASALGRTSINYTGKAFFEIPRAFDGNSYLVCSALGHLYEIVDSGVERSIFPIFDVDWVPKAKTGRIALKCYLQVTKRLELISRLALKASKFVNACDYDLEGETIGANIIEFACKDPGMVMRARFSTLVDSDIRQAFSTMKIQDSSLTSAGRFRHEIDFLWGINFSRALTRLASRSSGRFSNVSIGRVQGPTLAFVVQRELEHQTHIPLPSWNISCSLKVGDSVVVARYARSPVSNEKVAKTVYAAVSRSESALVTSLQTFVSKIPPRYPFDLGELQREAFQILHFSPSTTLRIAEKLYLSALISYPRTESQRLPPSIKPMNILNNLGKSQAYSDLVKSLYSEVSMRKVPLQGPRDDPAHPAIYPTGVVPKFPLAGAEKNLFDLIVRRFCNTFAQDAIVEKRRTAFEIASYEFFSEEDRLVEEGWMKFYPFRKKTDDRFHNLLVVGERLSVEKANDELLYSKAPARYNEGSLLAKMETEGLGTKATRAEIIATIINRGYASKSRLIPTENALNLGFELEDRCPEIMLSDMTRALEKKLQLIQEKSDSAESVLVESLKEIRNSLRNLRGSAEFQWLANSQHAQTSQLIGDCPRCKAGQLYAMRSFHTKKRFIRCENTSCRASSPLPPKGAIRRTGRYCNKCGWPMIEISFAARKKCSLGCSNYSCKISQDQKGAG